VLKRIYEKRIRNAGIIALAALVAQTNSSVDVGQAVQVVNQMTPLLTSLITVVIVIALPILVFAVLAKDIVGTVRGR